MIECAIAISFVLFIAYMEIRWLNRDWLRNWLNPFDWS